MTKQIILCDLDGTLIGGRYELTVPRETLLDAVRAKQAEGHLIGLNSDTPLLPLKSWAGQLGMSGPLLCEKGQLLSLSPDGPVEVYGGMAPFFHRLRQQVMIRAHEEIPRAFVGVGDVTEFLTRQGGVYGADRCAILINGYRQCSFSAYALANRDGRLSAQDAELFERFFSLVCSVLGEDVGRLDGPDRNQDYGLLILHEKGASKSLAVQRLADQVGDDTELVMIGDGDADIISITREVRLCAVGNATPALKAKAKATGGVVADGTFTEGVLEILSRL